MVYEILWDEWNVGLPFVAFPWISQVFVGNDFQDDDWATRALQSLGIAKRPPRSRL